MSWTCGCGVANEEGTKFCSQCGSPKPQPAPAPPEPAAAVPPPPEPPPAPPQAAHQPPAAAPPARPAAVPKKKGGCGKWFLLLLLLLLALCVILGAVGGVIYWKKGDVIREKLKSGELQTKTAEEWAREFGSQTGTETTTPEPAADPELERVQTALTDMGRVSAMLEGYRSDLGKYPNPGSNPDSYYSLVDLSAVAAELAPYGADLPATDPWGSPYEYGATQDSQSYVLICKGSDGMNKLEKIPETPVENRCYEEEIVLEKGSFIQQPASDARSCGGE